MKKLINRVEDVLSEQLLGLARAHPELTLHQDPVYVTRADAPVAGKVALLSGGGSGHEPMHCGYIGQGMLSGACPGEIFTSPTPDKMFECAMTIDGGEGVLLIIKNYTGDIMNFEMAAEMADAEGIKVEKVVVNDDVAVENSTWTTGRRGIAGTVFVHKIAGAKAETGASLEEVKAVADKVVANVRSMGMALAPCTVPAAGKPSFVLGEDEMEIGMGIHGEPGASVIDTQNSAQVVNLMVDKLLAALPETGRLAVMINNLGGVSVAEMAILTRELAHTPLHQRIDWLIGPASLVTALDMKGFSLTAIVLEESIEKALLTEVETSNWPTPVPPREISCVPSSQRSARVEFQPSANALVAGIVELVTTTLSDLETHLNALDAKVGDGDTGSTFSAGAREIASLLHRQQLPLDNLATLFALIGERLTVVMGGSSGVLMSIFFTAAGQKLEQGASVAESLNTGLAQMKFYGGADEGDRTMIDALQPALTSLLTQPQNLQAAFDAAQAGAERTCLSSKANAGRASYLSSESLLGNMDPGAHAVAMVFKALAESELG